MVQRSELRYRVVVPQVPHLGHFAADYVYLAVFPGRQLRETYTYIQTLDVLKLFGRAWVCRGSSPLLEPYAESEEPLPGTGVRVVFTLSELELAAASVRVKAAVRAEDEEDDEEDLTTVRRRR